MTHQWFESVAEAERRAKRALPRSVFLAINGGAECGVTLAENCSAFGELGFAPHVAGLASERAQATTVMGQEISLPVILSPTGVQAVHPEGELAVARAAAAAGIVQVLSTLSGHSLEDVAAASGGPRWFQLYCYRDRGITQELVARAEAAGFLAICVTVDVPVLGHRERDARNRFRLPPGTRFANVTHQIEEDVDGSALLQYVGDQLDASLTWESLDWLRGITRLPIVVKGILAAEDARLAVEHGVAGICVSNHGGRQLDGVVATCEALPEIADAVGDGAEIYVDGGIRRGVDILKAIALGARAVLIGRPYLWALAVDGEAGVRRVLGLFHGELERCMALAGCPRIGEIRRSLIAS
jgi:4-hydroxymandelate oxidase